MKKRKITAGVLVLLLLLQFMTSCARDYHVQFFDNAEKWLKEDFASSTPLKSEDKSAPSNLTFIIKTQDVYDRIFKEDIPELAIDFESQMIIIYTFTDYDRRENVLVDFSVENDAIRFVCDYRSPLPGYGYACEPYQRWYVVKMDKFDVRVAIFEIKC